MLFSLFVLLINDFTASESHWFKWKGGFDHLVQWSNRDETPGNEPARITWKVLGYPCGRREWETVHYLKVIALSSDFNLDKNSQIIKEIFRAPGWLSRLSLWLQLRSWSRGLWVWALSLALCWQLRAWSLLPSLSAPPPRMLCLSLSLSLSKLNKH